LAPTAPRASRAALRPVPKYSKMYAKPPTDARV